MVRRAGIGPLSPYTTLFRSRAALTRAAGALVEGEGDVAGRGAAGGGAGHLGAVVHGRTDRRRGELGRGSGRDVGRGRRGELGRLERLAGTGGAVVDGAAVVGRLVGEAAHRHGGRGAGIGDAAGVEVDGAGRAALTRAAGALVEREADVAGRGATGGGAGHLGAVVHGRTDRRRGDHRVRRVVHVGRGRRGELGRLERLAGTGGAVVDGAAVVGRLVGEAAHRHGGRGAGIGDAAGVEVDGAGRAALTRAAGALVEREADVAGRGATGGGAGHLGAVVHGRTDRRRGDHRVRRVVHVGRGRRGELGLRQRFAGTGGAVVDGAAVVGRLVGEAAHRHGGRGAGIGDAAGVEVDGAGRAALTRAAGALVEREADVAGRGATGGGAGHLGAVVHGRTDRRRGDHRVRRVVHVGRGRRGELGLRQRFAGTGGAVVDGAAVIGRLVGEAAHRHGGRVAGIGDAAGVEVDGAGRATGSRAGGAEGEGAGDVAGQRAAAGAAGRLGAVVHGRTDRRRGDHLVRRVVHVGRFRLGGLGRRRRLAVVRARGSSDLAVIGRLVGEAAHRHGGRVAGIGDAAGVEVDGAGRATGSRAGG